MSFDVGDDVDHKTFGRGVITKIDGDTLHIHFNKMNATKKTAQGLRAHCKNCVDIHNLRVFTSPLKTSLVNKSLRKFLRGYLSKRIP